MGGAHRPASCICNVSSPTWGSSKHCCYFRDLRTCEVRHSRAPIGPGDAGEEMLIPPGIICVYVYTRDDTAPGRPGGEGLGHRDGAERRNYPCNFLPRSIVVWLSLICLRLS
jgi:hypothetical protein